MSDVVELMLVSATIATWIAIVFMLKSMLRPNNDSQKLLKQLKECREEAKQEVSRLRQHYEMLLKDAAVKNAIMVSLYNAWKTGELKRCYEQGGDIRVLADGTLLCRKEKLEKSYRIKEVEEVESSE